MTFAAERHNGQTRYLDRFPKYIKEIAYVFGRSLFYYARFYARRGAGTFCMLVFYRIYVDNAVR